MKSDQMFKNLKELAEKFGITVSEQNFRRAGIRVKSGICRVKGREKIIIDKFLTLNKKNSILAGLICKRAYEDIYVLPAVRDFLDKKKERKEQT